MNTWSDDWQLDEIKQLLLSFRNEDLDRARELTREILTNITNTLVRLLWTRQQLMELIASSKRQSEAILQLDREYILIEYFKWVAKEIWLDPDCVTQYIWLITAAGKETQRQILNRDTVFIAETLSPETLRTNLLALTESVASQYDNYWKEFSATRLMREYETTRIMELGSTIEDKWVFLDIGCANGNLTEQVANCGFNKSIWYDISPVMIATANSTNQKRGTYKVYDIFLWIPQDNNSVDFIVVNFGAASEVSADIFPEISRVLKVGWKAYLSFYNNNALSNIWWQPWQTSIEWVKNPLCDIIEVPIITNDGVKTFKCYAHGTNIDEIRWRVKDNGLFIVQAESPGFLPSMLPPIFFKDNRRTQIAIEYENWHASMEPFLWPYLNIVVSK